jgi:DNA primase
MGKQFSSKELYELRNSIPIHVLIETQLGIPAKISEGVFRFLCPLCNEFQTAVNPKTNLSRCFRCEKNFNTIDMVMICHNTDFIDSVRYLKTVLNSRGSGHDT